VAEDYFSAGFGAISSLFGGISGQKGQEAAAKGSDAAAAAFHTGAEIAGQNVELEKMSTDVQGIQAERKVVKTIGSMQAGLEGAGVVATSGTGIDLLRDSTAQGHLTSQMIGVQGEINANAFRQQQAGLEGQAAQAEATAAAQRAAGKSDMFGGILGAVGKIGGLFF
jgi:hypothetical protein